MRERGREGGEGESALGICESTPGRFSSVVVSNLSPYHLAISGTCSPTPHSCTPSRLSPLLLNIPHDVPILSKCRDYVTSCVLFFFFSKSPLSLFSLTLCQLFLPGCSLLGSQRTAFPQATQFLTLVHQPDPFSDYTEHGPGPL